MKVLHIITSLSSGGTEGLLYRLIRASKTSVEHSIICLKKGGKYETLFEKEGIEVLVLNMKFSSLLKGVIKIYKFSKVKRKEGYQIITSWLYHADFVAWFVKFICGFKGLAWNIRSSKLQRGRRVSFKNWIYFKVLALLSHIGVNKIISCSRATLEIHKKIGYRNDIFTFIPNGYFIDINNNFKREYKDYHGTYRICMVARWHPQKDFENLFQALDLLKYHNISFHLTIAGNKTDPNNQEIVTLLKKYKLEKYCTLLGEVDDIKTVYMNAHVNILSSAFGETFPNVLSESMLNYTPCISTDVGDAKTILSEVGLTVPIGDYKKLTDALIKIYRILRHENEVYLNNCLRGFEKVSQNYNIHNIARIYYDAWKSLV